MPNRRDFDHIGSFNFEVNIPVITQGSFFYISGIESLTEVVEFRNGNDLAIRKVPGRTSHANIIMRRGFTNLDDLWQWHRSVTSGNIDRQNGSIVILGGDGETDIVRFNFFEAWPCRYELGVFDAEDDYLLYEEIEIVVERIERG